MVTFINIIYILVCFGLTIVILLQSSKGGGLAGAFGGGGGMGAVFGGRGAATFLSRVTTVLAIIFLAGALLLSFLNRGPGNTGSLVEQERAKRSALPGAGLPVVPTDDDTQQLLPMQTDEATAEADSSQ